MKSALECEIDARLGHYYGELAEDEKLTLADVAPYLRAAYANGYSRALVDPVEDLLSKAHPVLEHPELMIPCP